jgi:hypothetical protein
VDDNTVLAVFGGDLMLSVMLTSQGNGSYSGFFDVARLGTSFVFPSLSVRADDKAGNHGDVGIELIADNVPPVISLDPPLMQVSESLMNDTVIACSAPFDPVGTESASDGDSVDQIIPLKARVEDGGNSAKGLIGRYFSGLNPSSVKLVIIPISNGPLVVDSDGDGICDEINPLLIPVAGAITASDQSIELNLEALPASGTPDFSVHSGTAGPGNCTQTGDTAVTTPPAKLCSNAGTSLSYILTNGTDPTPEIFTIPPAAHNSFQCVGLPFDSKNRIGPGKACAAVQGFDIATNRGVSAPLHLCIRDAAGLGCAGYTFAATDCTGKFDKTTMKVVAGTCTPRTFKASGEVEPL